MTDVATNLAVLNGIIAAILAASGLTAPEANKPTEITQPVAIVQPYQRTAADEAAYEALIAKLAAQSMKPLKD